jgi:hypothetical protein
MPAKAPHLRHGRAKSAKRVFALDVPAIHVFGSEIRRNVRPFTFAVRRRAYPFAATRLAGPDAQPENGI